MKAYKVTGEINKPRLTTPFRKRIVSGKERACSREGLR